MHRRIRFSLVLVVLLLTVTLIEPVQAQGNQPPTLAPLRSVRVATLFYDALTGPLLVCQREFESWGRWHDTCQGLNDTPYYPEFNGGAVVENVLYDGVIYSRKNQETRWAAREATEYNAVATINAGLFSVPFTGVVTNLGAASVNGTATTQYQYWITDRTANEQVNGQLVYDLFIGSDGLVYKDHASIRSSNSLTRIRTYTQHNAPIVVSPPPANLVDQNGSPVINPL